MTAVILVLSALRPQAWWRRIGVWFSLSSFVEVYLSLVLLIYLTQVTLLASYGATAPILGTANLPASILGLDMAFYQNPALSATFTLDFFLSLVSLSLLGGGQFHNFLRNRETLLVISDLTRGVKEVHLTPPYQRVWLSSTDQDLNPLGRDPEKLTDDQLALSFDKLSKTLQPGGIVSVIVPAWASSLADRLIRLMPWAGLRAEKSEIVYRVPGKPENELVFRKLIEKPKEKPTLELVVEGRPAPPEVKPEPPPVTSPETEPVWALQHMTRQERAMLRSAASIIERRKEPVPYKDLLNEVYMDLLDRKVEFESAKQIETTLLKHTGRELAVLDEPDETGTRVVRKWWLGDRGVEQEGKQALNALKRISNKAKPALPKVRQLLNKWQRQRKAPRYKKKKYKDED